MVGFLLDHFVFKSRRWTLRTKWIVFTLVAGAVVGTFLWFRECAWGIEGALLSSLKYRAGSVNSAPKLTLTSLPLFFPPLLRRFLRSFARRTGKGSQVSQMEEGELAWPSLTRLAR